MVHVHLCQSAPTTAPTAPRMWMQQYPTIVGNGRDDEMISSMALSANASRMVIGFPGQNNCSGYVEVYQMEKDVGNWSRLGDTIYGNVSTVNITEDDDDYYNIDIITGDYFGSSVDITPDGTTIICGSPGYADYDYDHPAGYVRVFKLESDNTWGPIGQKITGKANDDQYDQFGYSASISDDGKTIAVGIMNDDNYSGFFRIYQLDDDGMKWEQIGDDIDVGNVNYDPPWSVSMLANRTIIVAIGAPEAVGQVNVFLIDCVDSSCKLRGTESISGDNGFGSSVDISSDGKTIAIGAPAYYWDDSLPGYVRVFSLDGIDNLGNGDLMWKQIGKDITGRSAGDNFGYSVSLSDDGKTLAVGANYANGIEGNDYGHVRVYRRNDSESDWTNIGNDIEGEFSYDNLGESVSLSGDGSTVAIGSYYLNSDFYTAEVGVYVLDSTDSTTLPETAMTSTVITSMPATVTGTVSESFFFKSKSASTLCFENNVRHLT